jgi:hypothetical protein
MHWASWMCSWILNLRIQTMFNESVYQLECRSALATVSSLKSACSLPSKFLHMPYASYLHWILFGFFKGAVVKWPSICISFQKGDLARRSDMVFCLLPKSESLHAIASSNWTLSSLKLNLTFYVTRWCALI